MKCKKRTLKKWGRKDRQQEYKNTALAGLKRSSKPRWRKNKQSASRAIRKNSTYMTVSKELL